MATNRLKELSERERKVINLVIRGRSKSQALREGGYTKEYVQHHIGTFFNRDKIQRELQKRRKAMAKKADVDAEWIAERLKAIADLDVGHLIAEDGTPMPMSSLNPSLRKALSVTITATGKVKITQDDRLRALDQLAKVTGLYEDKIKLDVEQSLTERLLAGRKRSRAGQEDS